MEAGAAGPGVYSPEENANLEVGCLVAWVGLFETPAGGRLTAS